jgi:hypothetical protein
MAEVAGRSSSLMRLQRAWRRLAEWTPSCLYTLRRSNAGARAGLPRF